MNHDLALLAGSWCLAIPSASSSCELLIVALVQQGCYAQSKGLSLRPAAIREGRIIGRGRREVPCLVGGIEARAVSLSCVSS